MIRRILVPLDGSPAAEEALAHAAAVGRSQRATLTLLQVVEAGTAPTEAVASGVDRRLQRAEAVAYLGEVARRLAAESLEATAEVAEGRAADEIVHRARAVGADLVVLATHGLGEALGFPVGGTVQKALSLVPCSVMVVRAGAAGLAPPARVAYRRILVPVDGSPSAEWALCLAASIAREHQAELLLLQVVPEVPVSSERIPPSPEELEILHRLRVLREERGGRYLREMGAQFETSGLRVRSRLVSAGTVAACIQRLAGEECADLIVVSAHGVARAPVRYGRVVQRLMIGCDAPLLVLQDLPEEGQATSPLRAAGV
jgi:nucleotide-binding universal stress UspA family protein